MSEAISLSPRGFSGLIYNVFRGTLARLLITQIFGFINGVDNVNWPPYRDSKS